MRINGQWTLCDDGAIRPVVQGLVRVNEEKWVEVPFLLDAGADRTVFSAQLIDLLRPLENHEAEKIHLAGIGGLSGSITIETVIGFKSDEGRIATVRGTFGVFTQIEFADMSVLGRDLTNNFNVIYDYPNQLVALLAPPHFYEIKKAS